MKLKKANDLIPGGRYHNFKDFIKFPKIGTAELVYPDVKPLFHKELKASKSLFKVIEKKTFCLATPINLILTLLIC